MMGLITSLIGGRPGMISGATAVVMVSLVAVHGTQYLFAAVLLAGIDSNSGGADAFIIFLVSAITVVADLAIAVIVGVIVSALVFAWKHAQHINADVSVDENGWKIYALKGPLFFGSAANFKELFSPETDPDHVVIEFVRSRVSDHSGIEALDSLAEKYSELGKKLHIRHLSPECITLLEKAGDLCEVNLLEDPAYPVASDKLG